ncbi:hypothetical protein Q9L58_000891 [Maublancomyces gigas]|uniref:Uncharacterized protein n=1 Tax=Discina gigas TaxID=1032678 RepID=A0ABR3GVU6_9PEZI
MSRKGRAKRSLNFGPPICLSNLLIGEWWHGLASKAFGDFGDKIRNLPTTKFQNASPRAWLTVRLAKLGLYMLNAQIVKSRVRDSYGID